MGSLIYSVSDSFFFFNIHQVYLSFVLRCVLGGYCCSLFLLYHQTPVCIVDLSNHPDQSPL